MKLRLQFNSIRLRLKRGEVERFGRMGRVEEHISSGAHPTEVFHYALEATDAVSSLTGSVMPGSVTVQVPVAKAFKWASTDQIAIEGEQPTNSQASLRILVEKDFACIDGTEEQNADTFPNPLAEQRGSDFPVSAHPHPLGNAVALLANPACFHGGADIIRPV